MKRCPQCGAEYDDYVQYCFVDGAELADAASVNVVPPAPNYAPPPPPPPPTPAPAPAPIALAPGVIPAVAPSKLSRTPRPAPIAEPPPRAMPLWAMGLVLLMLVAAFGLVSLAGVLLLVNAPEPPQAVAPAPRPPPQPQAPIPAMTSRPTPDESSITQVPFDSDPPGATVYEQGQPLCTTPCRVPHPEYAPLPREFVLKLDGFNDTDYKMTDPAQAQVVKLSTSRSSRPRPRPSDEILTGR